MSSEMIVAALSETIRIIARINKVIGKYRGWLGAYMDKTLAQG
jgi:hypothetical protein